MDDPAEWKTAIDRPCGPGAPSRISENPTCGDAAPTFTGV
jgi:hypothetical protein